MLSRDKKFIREYESYAAAERDLNITKGLVGSCISSKKYFSSGYYWIPKNLYTSGEYTIPDSHTNKFYNRVKKIDGLGNVVGYFDNMYDAGQDIGVYAHKIYDVVSGKKKTVHGFHYEYV